MTTVRNILFRGLEAIGLFLCLFNAVIIFLPSSAEAAGPNSCRWASGTRHLKDGTLNAFVADAVGQPSAGCLLIGKCEWHLTIPAGHPYQVSAENCVPVINSADTLCNDRADLPRLLRWIADNWTGNLPCETTTRIDKVDGVAVMGFGSAESSYCLLLIENLSATSAAVGHEAAVFFPGACTDTSIGAVRSSVKEAFFQGSGSVSILGAFSSDGKYGIGLESTMSNGTLAFSNHPTVFTKDRFRVDQIRQQVGVALAVPCLQACNGGCAPDDLAGNPSIAQYDPLPGMPTDYAGNSARFLLAIVDRLQAYGQQPEGERPLNALRWLERQAARSNECRSLLFRPEKVKN